MRIAIVGYERQGRSAFDYWGPGNEITICDRDPNVEIPSGVDSQLGEQYLDNLDRFNLIVRTSGLHPKHIVKANGERILRKVTTVTEEFFRNCPCPIIGVTGSKGKGTTSMLITELLKAAGKRTFLGGNIGISPLELLKENLTEQDYVVLELANFQLIDLHVSPPVAVCLLVTPEHLDWHDSLAEYLQAKQNIFKYQNDEDLAIYNRKNDLSGEVVSVSPALKISYEVPAEHQLPEEKTGAYILNEQIYYDDEIVCNVHDVALLGRHNLENVCAAIAATWKLIDGDVEVIKKVLRNFKNLPHRLENVREINGVTYYNDSFAAAIGACIAALNAISGHKVLIAGGYDRGLPIEELGEAIADKRSELRKVFLIGQVAEKLAKSLEQSNFKNYEILASKDMEQIVQSAHRVAKPGDAVLLSPGFASFDMFKDFEDRGNRFKNAVNEL